YWGGILDARWLAWLVSRQRDCLFEERSVPLFNDGSTAGQLFAADGLQHLPIPLLASWWKLGRDYIHMLSDITSSGERHVDSFVEIAPDCLLHNIQLDFLYLDNRAVMGVTAREFECSDSKRKL
ncbi:exodeoxyribonuclease V subunit gamma, partial [Enterobacter bugandensis]|uniref:exodeoxyribonuclease V subunit gamma n=1 Tax=Enterobacter bugandensis TaxID=881260 RepID=UPI002E2A176C